MIEEDQKTIIIDITNKYGKVMTQVESKVLSFNDASPKIIGSGHLKFSE